MLIKKIKNNDKFKYAFLCDILFYLPFFLIIFILLSPFVLTFKKFGKKSYFRRLPKVYSKCKIITDSIIFVIVLIYIVIIYKTKKKAGNLPVTNTKDPLEYLKILFCCCKKKENEEKTKEDG